jgi:hypothetical protein
MGNADNYYAAKILRPYLPPNHHNLFIAFALLIKPVEVRSNNSYDQYDKILQAFYTTKSAKGTGLGLSIVKRLVEIYEGSITFETEVGKGTIFVVELSVDVSERNHAL